MDEKESTDLETGEATTEEKSQEDQNIHEAESTDQAEQQETEEDKDPETQQEESEHKPFSETKTLIIGIVGIIVVIALIGVIAKLIPDNGGLTGSSVINYNGFEFTEIAGSWYFQWQRGDLLFNVPLRFNPLQTEEVPVLGDFNTSMFDRGGVYVTFDPDNDKFTYIALAATELSVNLAQTLDVTPIAGCTKNISETCAKRKIVNCGDKGRRVIYLREQEPTRVIAEGDCLILQGKEFELVRAVDRALYRWLGIQ